MSGRFALFGGDHYYPLGGWEDFLGVFGSLDEAIAAGVASIWSGSSGHPGSWWHVVEIDSRNRLFDRGVRGMVSRREELIIGLLRNHDLGASAREGVRGDDGSVALLPHASNCRMRTSAPARCSCWLRSLRELERCLRLMRAGRETRPLWYAVFERYLACQRKPMLVKVVKGKPVPPANVQVIGLVNTLDLDKKGNGYSRLLVEVWREGINDLRVHAGIRWLAETFQGSPELPVELMEAAA